MVSALCCWDSASGVMLSLQLYTDKGRMTEARPAGPPRPLLYSLKCDMQKDLGNNGCDCEDEEGCQAIHGPSCKCKESSSDLFVFIFQRRLAVLGALSTLQMGAVSKLGSGSNQSWVEHGAFLWLCLVLKLPL